MKSMPTFLRRNQNSLYDWAKEYCRDHNIIGSHNWGVMDLFLPPSHTTRYFPVFFVVGAVPALRFGSMEKFGGIFTPELSFGVLLVILIAMRIHDAFIYRAAVKLSSFIAEQEERLKKYTDDQLSGMPLEEFSEVHGEPEDDYISAIYGLVTATVILGVPGLWFIYMFLN
jgi:hypothetical protein